MKRIKYIFLLFLCTVCFLGGKLPEAKAAGGGLIRQVQEKQTPPGRWVRGASGYRYRYTYGGRYARNTWLSVKGKCYYMNSKGYRFIGVKKYQGKYYFLNGKGVLKTGWRRAGSKKYYFAPKTGAAYIGWKNIGGNRYYFNKKGVMQTNCWVSDCYLGADGVMARNTVVDGYYVDEDGKRELVELEDGQPEEVFTKRIFVGDSRTVGMSNTVGGEDIFIGEVGEGYQWFSAQGIKKLKKALKDAPQSKVIINLGVNDLGSLGNYISLYQTLIVQYPQARFYFLSVNPIEAKLAKASGYNTQYVNNSSIETFNNGIRAAFPGAYLDSYQYLLQQGLVKNVKAGRGTVDGIHYTSSVYWAIYNYVLSMTGE